MSYKLLYKTETEDKWQWVLSPDGGKTKVVIDTPADYDHPSDLLIHKLYQEQNPREDFVDTVAANAHKKAEQAKQRILDNQKVLRSYRIK